MTSFCAWFVSDFVLNSIFVGKKCDDVFRNADGFFCQTHLRQHVLFSPALRSADLVVRSTQKRNHRIVKVKISNTWICTFYKQ